MITSINEWKKHNEARLNSTLHYVGNLLPDNTIKVYSEDKEYAGKSLEEFFAASPGAIDSVSVGFNPSTGKDVIIAGYSDIDEFTWTTDIGEDITEFLEDVRTHTVAEFIENVLPTYKNPASLYY